MPFVHKNTFCGLCGKLIEAYDDIIAVPSIFCNRNDPMYAYNDRAFHKKCFESAEEAEKILHFIELVKKEYSKKECCICGDKILSADDMLFVPVISSNEENAVSKYNCRSFHKNCYEMSGAKADIEAYLSGENLRT